MLTEIWFNLFVVNGSATEALRELFPLVSWIPGMIVLTFVLLEPRPALALATGFVATSAALMLGYGLTHASQVTSLEANSLAQAFVLGPAFCIVMLRVVVGLSAALSRAEVESRAFAGLALTDELTGLPNRRAAARALDHALAQVRRNEVGAAVVMIDLDHFKQVNDTLGHEAGDLALRHAARVLGGLARGSDTLCRWGGEEFLLVCSSHQPIDLAVVGERLRSALESSPVPELGVTLTASFGGAKANASEPAEALLQRADDALYQAKRDGRNRVVLAPDPKPAPSPAA